jgi:hypothetical protein
MQNWTARPEPISGRVARRSRADDEESAEYTWRRPDDAPPPPPRSADYSDERWR